ncbi:MAG TPA: Mut7-C RNAse domain-containing protein [Herpetosiphonaceae bacterium]|nr:Mut7-C RNAse domain-containing protein [Herpetosiphonaceae bacterium]
MLTVQVRFHGDLNDFLGRRDRQRPITVTIEHTPSVKDLIESLGVPHPEVDIIIANGRSIDWAYLVQDSDMIEVFPPGGTSPPGALIHLWPELQPKARFILDTHLGRLAGYLRMLGFDTLYRNDYHDQELALISTTEDRILLTRDRGLLKRGIVVRGYYVRETTPRRQVLEILGRYKATEQIVPFRRCIRCNGLLRLAPKEEVYERLPPKTRHEFDEFRVCDTCGSIFWKGSHYAPMQEFVAFIRGHARNERAS